MAEAKTNSTRRLLPNDIHITMNVYSHSSYAHAEKAMLRIADGGSINKVSTSNRKGDGIDSLCP